MPSSTNSIPKKETSQSVETSFESSASTLTSPIDTTLRKLNEQCVRILQDDTTSIARPTPPTTNLRRKGSKISATNNYVWKPTTTTSIEFQLENNTTTTSIYNSVPISSSTQHSIRSDTTDYVILAAMLQCRQSRLFTRHSKRLH